MSRDLFLLLVLLLFLACKKKDRVFDEDLWIGTWTVDRQYNTFKVDIYPDGRIDTIFQDDFSRRDTVDFTFALNSMLEVEEGSGFTYTLCWYYQEYARKMVTMHKRFLDSDLHEFDLFEIGDRHQEWQINVNTTPSTLPNNITTYYYSNTRFVLDKK